ncbi:tRNA3(Ser)-specific nuclease WapA precursor [Gimesia chilikensis]|uniref:tRNA3(Ser)-specific nuclease WapA n=1 Tax=Gimesia chilikensis TaxID=2605989 RepID=A0A517PSQ8_9PLAN|nr:tRNA3(Ser)-specific nuclease WapA precursor [Gimesia chilikensis]
MPVTDDTGEITTWTYDGIDQLISENIDTDVTTFAYDPVGNRLLKETATGVTTSVYDAANELITSEETSGITTYTYDNNGNQRSIETPTNDVTTNSWEYENRLSQIELPDDSLVTYIYDPTNKQDEYVVQKQTDAETVKYIWDNQNILQEYDVTTEAQFNYQPEAYGNLISQYRDAESSFYHYDGNASASALTDASETETDAYKYAAFGETISSSGTTVNPFTWKGEIGYYQDENGQTLIRNRRYSAGQGRFLSEDPLGLESGESNFFAYVGNNPVNGMDPSGLKKAIWVPYGGIWDYLPFCNGTISWALDDAEIEKLKVLSKVIVDARFQTAFLANNKDALNCFGISNKDIDLLISKTQELEEFAMAYGRAIQAYIPQGYSNPGTVRTFDFAEYEGRKPWIKRLLQAGLEGFVIGID